MPTKTGAELPYACDKTETRCPMNGFQRAVRVGVLFISLLLLSAAGAATDTASPNSPSPATPPVPSIFEPSTDACKKQDVPSPLALFDVIERALCENPKTRSAWAAIKAATAGVGISKSAYLPTLDAGAKYGYQGETTEVTGAPGLQSSFGRGVNEESLSLSWVLYDFGARGAALADSLELLNAAKANQQETIQLVFANVAKNFFAAQAAYAEMETKSRLETLARENLDVATERVDKGVAPITDQLQASTAVAQATFERAKAEGDTREAIGALAADMNMAPNEYLTLPAPDFGVVPDARFVQGVNDLLEQARRSNPKVLAAAAHLQAALANVRFARAQGMPIVRLVGEEDRSNQPVSASLGQPELPALTRNSYIGLKIDVPLLDGVQRHYEIRQAEAQAEVEEENVRETQREVAVDVWSSVQVLQTDTENIRNTDTVRQRAHEAFDAAQHRYRSGVGNIVELLSAQAAVASAEDQWIRAQLQWRTARIELAESLGDLGMWAIE
jgi:outer membrane protein